jgi:hypothetical protein
MRQSIFRKDKMYFKRFLFSFLVISIIFYFLLFLSETSENPSSLKLFSYWNNSTFQSPAQDKINRQMYQQLKNNMLYSDKHFMSNPNMETHLEENAFHFDISTLMDEHGKVNNLVRLSLFKLVLVQLLTFIWKIITLNSNNRSNILLILEDFILDYHVIEASLHYFVIGMMFVLIFLLRRFVVKKR